MESIWKLVDEWETAWEKYKTGEFWDIQTAEIEETAQTLFRKLTRLSKEYKEKGYKPLKYFVTIILLKLILQLDNHRRYKSQSGRLPKDAASHSGLEESCNATKTLEQSKENRRRGIR